MPAAQGGFPQCHHYHDLQCGGRYDQAPDQPGFTMKRDEPEEEKSTYEEMRKKLMDALRRVFRPNSLTAWIR